MTERTKYELGDFNSKTSEYESVTCYCGRSSFKTFLPIYDERGIAEESYYCDCGTIYHWAYGNVVEKVYKGVDWLLKRAEDASLAESNLSAVRRHLREEEQQNKRYQYLLKEIKGFMETDAKIYLTDEDRLNGIHNALSEFYKEEGGNYERD